MEKEQIKQAVNALLLEMALHNRKLIELEKEFKEVFPIKEGEKVNILKTGDDSLEAVVRQAFVTRVKISYRGVNREAKIEFDLQRCRKDGEKSSMSDRLQYNEHIRKIQ